MTTKEEGRILLKIEQFSRFTSATGQPLTSAPVFLHKLPWIIKAEWKPAVGASGNVNCSVLCGVKNTDSRWSCTANIRFRVVAQKEGMAHLEKNLDDQLFNSQQKSHSCDYSVELLKDPEKGWYDSENDTIILEADIKVDTPKGLSLSLPDRMLYLLNSQLGADIRFLIGKEDGKIEKFAANKAILATVSDVFERMFAYDAKTGIADRVIEVPDVEPEAFRLMLNFIYAEELDGLNQDNVTALLYAAEKYNVVGLINICLNHILDAKGVLPALNQARYFQEKHEKLANYEFWNIEEAEGTLEFGKNGLVRVKGIKGSPAHGMINALKPLLIKERGIVYYELKIIDIPKSCEVKFGIGQKTVPSSTFNVFASACEIYTKWNGISSFNGAVFGCIVKFSSKQIIITRNGLEFSTIELGSIVKLDKGLDMALAISLSGQGCSVQLGRIEICEDEEKIPSF